MTYCGDEKDLPTPLRKEIEKYISEPKEKVEIKIITEAPCFFCKVNTSWFQSPAFISIRSGSDYFRAPVCSKCFKLMSIFRKS